MKKAFILFETWYDRETSPKLHVLKELSPVASFHFGSKMR